MSSTPSRSVSDLDSILARLAEYRSFQPYLVRAGAGAGKTTELVERILALGFFAIKEKRSLPKVIATTFTRKATQEMKERISLLALRLGYDHKLDLSESDRVKLIEWTQNPEHLWVTTLDGLILKLVQEVGALEWSLPAEIEFSSEQSEGQRVLARACLRRLLQENSEFSESAKVLFAQVPVDQVFDWCELIESRELQEGSLSPILSSFVLDQMAESLQLLKAAADSILAKFTAKTSAQQNYLDFLKEVQTAVSVSELRSLAIKRPSGTPKWPDDLKPDFQVFLDHFKRLQDPSYSDSFLELHEKFLVAFETFRKFWSPEIAKQRAKAGLLKIKDFEIILFKLLNSQMSAIDTFSGRWDYWFVDEYQDISKPQELWIEQIVSDQKVYRVGDPQQSIYLFRGARPDLFLKREKRLIEKQDHLYRQKLTNYRSQPEIVEFANEMFSIYPAFARMEAGRASNVESSSEVFSSQVQGWRINCSSSAESQSGGAEETDPATLVYEVCAERVQQLVSRGVAPDRIAILAPTRNQFLFLAKKFKELNIPVFFHGEGKIKGASLALDALRLMRFFVSPDDFLNLYCLLHSKVFSFDETQLFEWALSYRRQTRPMNSQLSLLSDLGGAGEKLCDWFDRSGQEGVISVWVEAIQQLEFFRVAKELDPSGLSEAELFNVVTHVQNSDREWIQSRLTVFSNLQDWLKSINEPGPSPSHSDRPVQVMTVHASKGLEFDHVLLPILPEAKARTDLESLRFFQHPNGEWSYGFTLKDPDVKSSKPGAASCFPFLEKSTDQEQLREEKLRSFYVAVTRARETLQMVWMAQDTDESSEKTKSTSVSKNGSEYPSSWVSLVPRLCSVLKDRVHDVARPDRQSIKGTSPGPGVIANSKEPLDEQRGFKENKNSKEKSEDPKFFRNFLPTVSVSQMVQYIEQDQSAATRDSAPKKAGQSKKVVLELNPYQEAISAREEGIRVHSQFQMWASAVKLGLSPTGLNRFREFLSMQAGSAVDLLETIMNTGESEWGFTCQMTDDQSDQRILLQGQIDLWGWDQESRLWVIDFKTGAAVDQEKAFLQLGFYAWALWQLKPFWEKNTGANPSSNSSEMPMAGEICLGVLDTRKKTLSKRVLTPGAQFNWGFDLNRSVRTAVLQMSRSADADGGIEH